MYSFKQVFGIIKKNSIFLKKKSQSPKPGHGSKAASTKLLLEFEGQTDGFQRCMGSGGFLHTGKAGLIIPLINKLQANLCYKGR